VEKCAQKKLKTSLTESALLEMSGLRVKQDLGHSTLCPRTPFLDIFRIADHPPTDEPSGSDDKFVVARAGEAHAVYTRGLNRKFGLESLNQPKSGWSVVS
jgi:hypothetical protein